MTKSRAYQPQSQDKFERSRRTLRKNIGPKQARKSVNWVKNLLEYSKCLNNDKREELGWRSAFEVYYGRNSNELVKSGVPVYREKEFKVQKVIQPLENLIDERQKSVGKEKEKAKNANKKACDRTVEYYRKRRKCSKYKKGKRVYQVWKEKREKSAKTKICHPCRGNQSR